MDFDCVNLGTNAATVQTGINRNSFMETVFI